MADNKRRKKVKSRSNRGPTPASAKRAPVASEPTKAKRRRRIPPMVAPILMFAFFALGVAMIILNYLPGAPLLPGDQNPYYLLGGLGLICFGFVAATRVR